MGRTLARNIRRAIKSGGIPKLRQWRILPIEKLTRAERIMRFIETYCPTPEGADVGKPMKVAKFQEAFIVAVYDNPHGTQQAILSIGRKNGKTALIAALLLAHIVSTEATKNAQIIAAALSREQASLVFKLASKMINLSPALQKLTRQVPSQKQIYGLKQGVEFKAIARDSSGGSTMGLSPVLILLDESGQVLGSQDAYVSALETSQGAHEKPLFMTISTQSPSDADWLSIQIDDAIRSNSLTTVCHVYEADPDCQLLSKKQWRYANPALGVFRSEKDLSSQLRKAARLPALESSARNLLLNQRVAQEALFLSANVFNRNSDKPDPSLFTDGRAVVAGLDLSARNDLTACVLAAKDDDGNVHWLTYVFCPRHGIRERGHRDRAPYDTWVDQGLMIPLGGESMDYDQICMFLARELKEQGINVTGVEFDRWRIKEFQAACERSGVFSEAEWHEVGQGFKDFSPRCESLLSAMLEGRIKHGKHPLMTMAASNAIGVFDPAGSVKLDKSKSTQRIDPLIAAIMASFPLLEEQTAAADVSCWI